MADLRIELGQKFDEENEHQRSELKRGNDRMQHLEDLLAKER